jgi:hypothetical protein
LWPSLEKALEVLIHPLLGVTCFLHIPLVRLSATAQRVSGLLCGRVYRPHVHKRLRDCRYYRGSKGDSNIPSPALSALVSLQELSITDFDQALEEVVPKDMLSEPIANDMMAISSEIPSA